MSAKGRPEREGRPLGGQRRREAASVGVVACAKGRPEREGRPLGGQRRREAASVGVVACAKGRRSAPVGADAPPAVPDAEAIVRVAWLYYHEGLMQDAIARLIGTNRARVIAWLAAARDLGVVRVHLAPRTARGTALEQALVARYGLRTARVTPAAIDPTATAALVGHAAGTWLDAHVRDGTSVGIGWGRTLEMSLKAVGDDVTRTRLSVVSLLGSLPHSGAVTPATVARRMADLLAADCYQLTAPLLVSDAAMRDALWREPALADLRERAARVDVALVSVGDLGRDATLFHDGVIPAAERASLAAAGAVGDVLGQFLDVRGQRVAHPINRRIVAFDLDALRDLPNVAIASGGVRKAAALRAALLAIRPAALITDEAAAARLVA